MADIDVDSVTTMLGRHRDQEIDDLHREAVDLLGRAYLCRGDGFACRWRRCATW